MTSFWANHSLVRRFPPLGGAVSKWFRLFFGQAKLNAFLDRFNGVFFLSLSLWLGCRPVWASTDCRCRCNADPSRRSGRRCRSRTSTSRTGAACSTPTPSTRIKCPLEVDHSTRRSFFFVCRVLFLFLAFRRAGRSIAIRHSIDGCSLCSFPMTFVYSTLNHSNGFAPLWLGRFYCFFSWVLPPPPPPGKFYFDRFTIHLNQVLLGSWFVFF